RVLPYGLSLRHPYGVDHLLLDSEIPGDGHCTYWDPHPRSAVRLRSDAHPLLYRCPDARATVYRFNAVFAGWNPCRPILDLLGNPRELTENNGKGGREDPFPQNARRV